MSPSGVQIWGDAATQQRLIERRLQEWFRIANPGTQMTVIVNPVYSPAWSAAGQRARRSRPGAEGIYDAPMYHLKVAPRGRENDQNAIYETNLTIYGARGNEMVLEQQNEGYGVYRGDIAINQFGVINKDKPSTTGMESLARRLGAAYQLFGAQTDEIAFSVSDLMYQINQEGNAPRNLPASSIYVGPNTSPEYLNFLSNTRNVYIAESETTRQQAAIKRATQDVRENRTGAWSNLYGGAFLHQDDQGMTFVSQHAVGTVWEGDNGERNLAVLRKNPLIKGAYINARRDIAEEWVRFTDEHGVNTYRKLSEIEQIQQMPNSPFHKTSVVMDELTGIPTMGYNVNRLVAFPGTPLMSGGGKSNVPSAIAKVLKQVGNEQNVSMAPAFNSFRGQTIPGFEGISDLFDPNTGQLLLNLQPNLRGTEFAAGSQVTLGTWGEDKTPISISLGDRPATVDELRMVLPAQWAETPRQQTELKPFIQQLQAAGINPIFSGRAGQIQMGARIAQFGPSSNKERAKMFAGLPPIGQNAQPWGMYMQPNAQAESILPGQEINWLGEGKSLPAQMINALEAMEQQKVLALAQEVFQTAVPTGFAQRNFTGYTPPQGGPISLKQLGAAYGFKNPEGFVSEFAQRVFNPNAPLFDQSKNLTPEYARQVRLGQEYGMRRVQGWMHYAQYANDQVRSAQRELRAGLINDGASEAEADYAVANYLKFENIKGLGGVSNAYFYTEALQMPGHETSVFEYSGKARGMDFSVIQGLYNQGLTSVLQWVKENQFDTNAEGMGARRNLLNMMATYQYNASMAGETGASVLTNNGQGQMVPFNSGLAIKVGQGGLDAQAMLTRLQDIYSSTGSDALATMQQFADYWSELVENPEMGMIGASTKVAQVSPLAALSINTSSMELNRDTHQLRTVTENQAARLAYNTTRRFLSAEAKGITDRNESTALARQIMGWIGPQVRGKSITTTDEPVFATSFRYAGDPLIGKGRAFLPMEEIKRMGQLMGMNNKQDIQSMANALSGSFAIFMRDPMPVLGSEEYGGGIFPVQLMTASNRKGWLNRRAREIQSAITNASGVGINPASFYIGPEKTSQGDWDADPGRLLMLTLPYREYLFKQGQSYAWNPENTQEWTPVLGKSGNQRYRWRYQQWKPEGATPEARVESYKKFVKDIISRQDPKFAQGIMEATMAKITDENGNPIPNAMDAIRNPLVASVRFAMGRTTPKEDLAMNVALEKYNLALQGEGEKWQENKQGFMGSSYNAYKRWSTAAGTALGMPENIIQKAGDFMSQFYQKGIDFEGIETPFVKMLSTIGIYGGKRRQNWEMMTMTGTTRNSTGEPDFETVWSPSDAGERPMRGFVSNVGSYFLQTPWTTGENLAPWLVNVPERDFEPTDVQAKEQFEAGMQLRMASVARRIDEARELAGKEDSDAGRRGVYRRAIESMYDEGLVSERAILPEALLTQALMRSTDPNREGKIFGPEEMANLQFNMGRGQVLSFKQFEQRQLMSQMGFDYLRAKDNRTRKYASAIPTYMDPMKQIPMYLEATRRKIPDQLLVQEMYGHLGKRLGIAPPGSGKWSVDVPGIGPMEASTPEQFFKIAALGQEQVRAAAMTYFDPNRAIPGDFAVSSSAIYALSERYRNPQSGYYHDPYRSSIQQGIIYGMRAAQEPGERPFSRANLNEMFMEESENPRVGHDVENVIASSAIGKSLGIHVGNPVDANGFPLTPRYEIQSGQSTFALSNLPDFTRFSPGRVDITDIKNLSGYRGQSTQEVASKFFRDHPSYLYQAASYTLGHSQELDPSLRDYYLSQGAKPDEVTGLAGREQGYWFGVTSFKSEKEAINFFSKYGKNELTSYMDWARNPPAARSGLPNGWDQAKLEEFEKNFRYFQADPAEIQRAIVELPKRAEDAYRGIVASAPGGLRYANAVLNQRMYELGITGNAPAVEDIEVIQRLERGARENAERSWSGMRVAEMSEGQLLNYSRMVRNAMNMVEVSQGRQPNMQTDYERLVEQAAVAQRSNGGQITGPTVTRHPYRSGGPGGNRPVRPVRPPSNGGGPAGGGPSGPNGNGPTDVPEDWNEDWTQGSGPQQFARIFGELMSNMFGQQMPGIAQILGEQIGKNMTLPWAGTNLADNEKRALGIYVGGRVSELVPKMVTQWKNAPEILSNVLKSYEMQPFAPGTSPETAWTQALSFAEGKNLDLDKILRQRMPEMWGTMHEFAQIRPSLRKALSGANREKVIEVLNEQGMGGLWGQMLDIAGWTGGTGNKELIAAAGFYGDTKNLTRGLRKDVLDREGLFEFARLGQARTATAQTSLRAMARQTFQGESTTDLQDLEDAYESKMADLDEKIVNLDTKQSKLLAKLGGKDFLKRNKIKGTSGKPEWEQLTEMAEQIRGAAWEGMTTQDATDLASLAGSYEEMAELRIRRAGQRKDYARQRAVLREPEVIAGRAMQTRYGLAMQMHQISALQLQNTGASLEQQDEFADFFEQAQARANVQGATELRREAYLGLEQDQRGLVRGKNLFQIANTIEQLRATGQKTEGLEKYYKAYAGQMIATEKETAVTQGLRIPKEDLDTFKLATEHIHNMAQRTKSLNEYLEAGGKNIKEITRRETAGEVAGLGEEAEIARSKFIGAVAKTTRRPITTFDEAVAQQEEYEARVMGQGVVGPRQQERITQMGAARQAALTAENRYRMAGIEEEESRKAAGMGGMMRRMLGGFGLMYMRSIYGLITEGAGTGYAEGLQEEQMAGQMGVAAFGGQMPTSTALRQQKILASMYGGVGQRAIDTWRSNIMQNQPGLYGFGSAAVAGLGAFGLSEWVAGMAGVTGGAALIPSLALAGGVGLLAANVNYQGAMQNVQPTAVGAASRLMQGQNMGVGWGNINWRQTADQLATIVPATTIAGATIAAPTGVGIPVGAGIGAIAGALGVLGNNIGGAFAWTDPTRKAYNDNPEIQRLANQLQQMRTLAQTPVVTNIGPNGPVTRPRTQKEVMDALGIPSSQYGLYASMFAQATSSFGAAANVSNEAWAAAGMFGMQYNVPGFLGSQEVMGRYATFTQAGAEPGAMARQMLAGYGYSIATQNQLTGGLAMQLMGAPQFQTQLGREQLMAGLALQGREGLAGQIQAPPQVERTAIAAQAEFDRLSQKGLVSGTPWETMYLGRQQNALMRGELGLEVNLPNVNEYIETTGYRRRQARQLTPETLPGYQAEMRQIERERDILSRQVGIRNMLQGLGWETGQANQYAAGITQLPQLNMVTNIVNQATQMQQRYMGGGGQAASFSSVFSPVIQMAQTDPYGANKLMSIYGGEPMAWAQAFAKMGPGMAERIGNLQVPTMSGMMSLNLLGMTGTDTVTGLPNGLPWGTTNWRLGGISSEDQAMKMFGSMMTGGPIADILKQAAAGTMQVKTPQGVALPGITLGGNQAIQYAQMANQWAAQQASAGAQMAGLNLGFAFQTGVGLQQYGGIINPVTNTPFNFNTGAWNVSLPYGGGTFRSQGGGIWGLEDASRALANNQQQYQFGQQRAQLEMGQRFFNQNMAMNITQTNMQRGWTREDWAYQTQQREQGWMWQQEDFNDQVRFMTGRERRLAERQMARATTVHGQEEDQIGKQRERQQELWKMEDQRFKVQKQQNEEQAKFQSEAITKQEQFYNENRRLTEEQVKLQRAYYVEEQRLQKAAAGAQAAAAEKAQALSLAEMLAGQNADVLKGTLQTMDDQTFTSLIDTISRELGPAFDWLIQKMKDVREESGGSGSTGGYGPTDPNAHKEGDSAGPNSYWHWNGSSWVTLPRLASGGGFYQNQTVTVGELGPEKVTFGAAGFVTPSFLSTWNNEVVPAKRSGIPHRGIQSVKIYIGGQFFKELILDTVQDKVEI